MGKIIDINAELEHKKAIRIEEFWAKLAFIYSTGIAEKIDREIMADIKKEEGKDEEI